MDVTYHYRTSAVAGIETLEDVALSLLATTTTAQSTPQQQTAAPIVRLPYRHSGVLAGADVPHCLPRALVRYQPWTVYQPLVRSEWSAWQQLDPAVEQSTARRLSSLASSPHSWLSCLLEAHWCLAQGESPLLQQQTTAHTPLQTCISCEDQ